MVFLHSRASLLLHLAKWSPLSQSLLTPISSLEASNGAGARAADESSGRKRSRPLGGQNKVKDLAATPPVPRRHGRPLGSHNKKMLEALAATATAEPFEAGRSTAIVTAPGRGCPGRRQRRSPCGRDLSCRAL
jgi:hypothetical protein